MSRKGAYIVFEGIDGTSKTTQSKLFVEHLKTLGYETELVVEPSHGHVGKLIRQMLSGDISVDPRVLGMLFPSDTLDQFVKPSGIVDMVNEGKIVVSDRNYFSSLAYQSVHIPIEIILKAHSMSIEILKPDILFYLYAPVEVCMERLNSRGEKLQIHEKEDFLKTVLKNYQETMKNIDCKKVNINTDRDVEAISGIVNAYFYNLESQLFLSP